MSKILLGVGPTKINKDALREFRGDIELCRTDFSRNLVKNQVQKLNYFFGENRYSFAIPGSGSVGMEACLSNLLQSGDVIVVGVAGIFGWRIVEMAKRLGVQVLVVEADLGKGVQLEKIIELLRHYKVKLVCLVHLETSVGVLQNLDSGFSNFLKERGTLLLLDVVASYGGIELELDKWGVDIAYASTQKCLSAPSGLALISYNDNARREIEKNAQKVNWCYDFSNIYRHISEGVYPYTTPLFLLNVLDSILNYIMKFGKETYINKQRHSGTRVKEIFESIGLKMLPESIWEAPQVKVFYTPPELDSYKIINVLGAIADVQPQNEVDVKPGKYRDRKRTRDGYQGAHGHLAYDFGLILGDILVYCYREHVRYRSFLAREGTPVDTGLEVHGSTHDDGTADNHGEGTGELTAAALHTVLDGKTKVHKAEDDEDAAEGGHTIREKVFHVFQHG